MSFVLLLPIIGLIPSNPIGMKDFNGVLRNRSQCMDEGCIDKFMKKLGKSAYRRRFRDHWYMLSLFLYSLSISMTLTLPFNLCVCKCMCVHTGMHRCACSLAYLWRPANNFRNVLVLTFDIVWDLILLLQSAACCRLASMAVSGDSHVYTFPIITEYLGRLSQTFPRALLRFWRFKSMSSYLCFKCFAH